MTLALGAGAIVYVSTEAREGGPTDPSAAAAFLAAQHARTTYDLDNSTKYYTEALKADPGDPRLLRQAYFQFALNGDFETAGPLAKSILTSGEEEFVFVAMVAAVHALKTENLSAARPYIREIPLSREPRTWQAMQAWSEADIKGLDAAKAIVQPMVVNAGYRGRAALTLATIAQYLGKTEDAAAFYETFFEQTRTVDLSVIETVYDFLISAGMDEQASNMINPFQSQAKSSIVMQKFLEQLMDPGRPKIEMTPERGIALVFLQSGRQLANRFIDFSVFYSRVAAYLAPDLESAHHVAGNALEADKHFEEANKALEKIGPDSPYRFSIDLQMALNLHRMGKTEDALARLDVLAKEWPERAEPQLFKGSVLSNNQRFAEAVQAYDAAEKLIENPQERNWQFYFNRGIALERSGDWPRAEEDFKTAIRINPKEPNVLNYLGYSWLDRGEFYEEARALIERAVEYSTRDDGSIIDSLGWAQYLAGEYNDAVENLERAVELKPGDPTINDHLGDVYWKVGRRTEAVYQWNRALSLDPDEDLALEIKRKINGNGLALN